MAFDANAVVEVVGALAGAATTLATAILGAGVYFSRKIEKLDRKIERLETKFENNVQIAKVEVKVDKLSSDVNALGKQVRKLTDER